MTRDLDTRAIREDFPSHERPRSGGPQSSPEEEHLDVSALLVEAPGLDKIFKGPAPTSIPDAEPNRSYRQLQLPDLQLCDFEAADQASACLQECGSDSTPQVYLPETATASELAAFKRSLATTDQLQDIKKEVNRHGKDPEQLLIAAARDPKVRVIGLGELHSTHGGSNPMAEFGVDILPKLAKAGATHLAVEISHEDKELLDNLDGDPKDLLKKFKAKGYIFDESFIKVLQAAKKAGLKLEPVDETYFGPDKGRRDRHMATKIKELLERDPQAKVIFWVGANHLRNSGDNHPSAGQLLKETGKTAAPGKQFETVYVASAQTGGSSDGNSTPNFLARGLKAPVAIPTTDASGFSNLYLSVFDDGRPWPKEAKVGQFDHVLIFPADVKLPAAPRRGRQEREGGGSSVGESEATPIQRR